jgi:hypothetical protein
VLGVFEEGTEHEIKTLSNLELILECLHNFSMLHGVIQAGKSFYMLLMINRLMYYMIHIMYYMIHISDCIRNLMSQTLKVLRNLLEMQCWKQLL